MLCSARRKEAQSRKQCAHDSLPGCARLIKLGFLGSLEGIVKKIYPGMYITQAPPLVTFVHGPGIFESGYEGGTGHTLVLLKF